MGLLHFSRKVTEAGEGVRGSKEPWDSNNARVVGRRGYSGPGLPWGPHFLKALMHNWGTPGEMLGRARTLAPRAQAASTWRQ